MIVGCLSVLVDTIVYFLLKEFIAPSIAKAISFICGTIVAYLLNKKWTFEETTHKSSKIFKFMALYLCTLGANIAVNHLSLQIVREAYLLAFLAATGTSTTLNFIGQKWWVFKKS
ncbi:GtrA family protein [Cohnella ginsengisoli]|uniref:GtrA family protein n=1 Tax=Cohnella ginsengisoli TaxID=425004 RepID=UPI003B8A6590